MIGHLAHDAVLKECLFQLGFGAILAEELRGLEPVGSSPGLRVEIVEDPDPHDLVELQTEHSRYYRQSPVFLIKDESEASILSELHEKLANGDRLLAGVANGEVVALFIAGKSAAEGEGALLRGANSAQVKSGYVRPQARGRGVGAALLERCIAWARQGEFDRLFVEHETANIPGSAFWGRFFEPYVFFSIRYVDSGL